MKVINFSALACAALVSAQAIAAGPSYRNPAIFADSPDVSLCCDGKYYYMVSTTMHMVPGAPVMRSKDMLRWEMVGYVFDRYLAIAKIVRERHPEIKLVSSAGASPIGGDHDLAWKTLTCQTADMIDEHFYANPGWMMGLVHQFDGYDRSKPKVYAGEYACHVEDKANSLYSALCEAACMMGFERNCDIVEMSSYAPLFGKIGCEQWKPDLIWFDNLRAFTTPNYHVQKMFGNNLPSEYIPSAQSGEVADFHQVCGFDKATGEYVVKCVNLAADRALDLAVDFGAELPAGNIKVETLTGDPKVVNDMANPERCRPESKSVAFAGGREFKTNLPASSLTIIRAKE